VEDRSLVVLSTDGGDLRIGEPARALVLSGVPLRELVAWRVPVVMNSWEELAEAFKKLERGHLREAAGLGGGSVILVATEDGGV
jgi:Pirin-related protein